MAADEQEHIRILKHESNTLSMDEKLMHWQACASTRINSLKVDGSKQIVESWPMYKEPFGYRLVFIMFN